MICKYCGKEMVEGYIESKAISGNGLAYSIVTFATDKLFHKKIRLKEKQKGYYCKECNIVVCEYDIGGK